MLAIIPSATLHGLDGRFIRVEVDVAPGLPGFTIVGLADTALQEARERVRGAIRNAGFSYPPRRITVNLAPADLRKGGASLDLAMALGILLGSEQVRAGPGRLALIGELSLGGEVRSVPGVLPMVAALARRGLKRVVVAAPAVDEARLIAGVDVSGVETLRRGRRADPDRPSAAPGCRLRRGSSSSMPRRSRPTTRRAGPPSLPADARRPTSARSAASSMPGEGSRSPSPAATGCC